MGAPMLLGAVAPMNLDALADHAAAEKAELKKQVEEAARQAEWLKTHGLSERERKLQKHAAAEAKILKLQNGQYMNLDALADHAAAEKAELKKQVEEAARQAEWLKTHGLSERERRLQEHAAAEAKILKLQNGQYLLNLNDVDVDVDVDNDNDDDNLSHYSEHEDIVPERNEAQKNLTIDELRK